MLDCHTCQIKYVSLMKESYYYYYYYKFWLACCTAGARFVFLSSSFLLFRIFSLFSNNATQHDLLNRQSINQSSSNQSINQQINQSINKSISQSVNIERLGNMGFTTISLSSNVKNSLDMRHFFYAIICYNDIKHENIL